VSDRTKIEWTDATWTPVKGCTRVSPGCGGPGQHGGCYAEIMAARFSKPGQWGEGLATIVTLPDGSKDHRWTGLIRFDERELLKPLSWKKPRRIFVCSTADLFHEKVTDEQIDHVFAVMALCPQHIFQVLTKRPERMRAWANDVQTPFRIARAIDAIAAAPIGEEELRPISRYPGYIASSHGAIYSEKRGRRKLLSPDVGDQGHCRVTLYRNGVSSRELVHRLILETFSGPPPHPEAQGRHRDGNAENNYLSNLSWGGQDENWIDSKRHGTHRRYSKLSSEQVAEIRNRHITGETGEALAREFGVSATQIRNIAAGKQWSITPSIKWPLPNVWKGTSVEDQQRANERVPHLLETPAVVRFLSCEPLLGPIDLTWIEFPNERGSTECYDALSLHLEPGESFPDGTCDGVIDWVIVGGESGPGARPMHPDWARSLRDQCDAADVPFFFKQWGEWAPAQPWYPTHPVSLPLLGLGPDGWSNESHVLIDDPDYVARLGKKAAGRLLDGVEHNGMPANV